MGLTVSTASARWVDNTVDMANVVPWVSPCAPVSDTRVAGPTGPVTTAETAEEQQTSKKTQRINKVRQTGSEAHCRGDGTVEKDEEALARMAAGAAGGHLGVGGLAETCRRGAAARAVVAPLVPIAGGILGLDPEGFAEVGGGRWKGGGGNKRAED